MGILSFVRGKMNEAKLDAATHISQKAVQAEHDRNYYKFMLEKQKKIEAAESTKHQYEKLKKKQAKRRLGSIKQALKGVREIAGKPVEKRGSPFELGGSSGFGNIGPEQSKEKKKNNPWNSGEGRNPFQ